MFQHGLSPAMRLFVCVTLAVFFMVADTRFQLVGPVRQGLGTILYPLRWLATQPIGFAKRVGKHMVELEVAIGAAEEAQKQVAFLSEKINITDSLIAENSQLRALLNLRQRSLSESQSAEVVYEAPNPYTNQIIIDRGSLDNVQVGSPVLDAYGVLGQITQVYPYTSEVRLVSDKEQATPVMNLRTGMRMLAFGNAGDAAKGGLELRYVPNGSDVKKGDRLVTSGIDGYYPSGLPVAEVDFVEFHRDAPFIRVYAQPNAQTVSARYVVVVNPVGSYGEKGPEPFVSQAQEAATAAVTQEEKVQ